MKILSKIVGVIMLAEIINGVFEIQQRALVANQLDEKMTIRTIPRKATKNNQIDINESDM